MASLHTKLLATPAAPQNKCPLYNTIPGEIRIYIFELAVADYEDPSPDKHYDSETYYTRPSYFAPRRSDTELLRTCRAVYRECWSLPFTLKEQTHWLTTRERAPPEYPGPERLAQTLESIAKHQNTDKVVIDSLRVFAQMWKLEQGCLADLLATPFLCLRSLTLTIRHADWWYWETDEPLRFEGDWIERVNQLLTPSVQEVQIELETVMRKKLQVSEIAGQMMERWSFKRQDGAILYADVTGGTCELSEWRGPSTWSGRRWIRDESLEGTIEYYIVIVAFRQEHEVERRGGFVGANVKRLAKKEKLSSGELKLDLPKARSIPLSHPFIPIRRPSRPLFHPADGYCSDEYDFDEDSSEFTDEEGDMDLFELLD